jgi:hypothetical protein
MNLKMSLQEYSHAMDKERSSWRLLSSDISSSTSSNSTIMDTDTQQQQQQQQQQPHISGETLHDEEGKTRNGSTTSSSILRLKEGQTIHVQLKGVCHHKGGEESHDTKASQGKTKTIGPGVVAIKKPPPPPPPPPSLDSLSPKTTDAMSASTATTNSTMDGEEEDEWNDFTSATINETHT